VLARKAISLTVKGIPKIGAPRLGVQVHLGRRGSSPYYGILDDRKLQAGAELSGQEGSLIIPALPLPAAVQRDWHNGIQLEVMRCKSIPSVCH
jgi:hypothetical protein